MELARDFLGSYIPRGYVGVYLGLTISAKMD
jgi:hypothetical protein